MLCLDAPNGLPFVAYTKYLYRLPAPTFLESWPRLVDEHFDDNVGLPAVKEMPLIFAKHPFFGEFDPGSG